MKLTIALVLFLAAFFTQKLVFGYPNGPSNSIIVVRTLYSPTPVSTSTWVTLVPSTSKAVSSIFTFDSSGQTMEIGDFTTGCTTLIQSPVVIGPGGNGVQSFATSQGDCIQIKAVSATASVGENDLNLFY